MNEVDISIIIPTKNRENILWQTLKKACEAIDRQKAEIIVVNDGERELQVPSEFENKVTFLNNSQHGVSRARNAGAAGAKGSILFFIDDDMWISRNIIEWIDKNLIKTPVEEAVYNINWEYPPSLNEKLNDSKIGRFILSTSYNSMWGRMNVEGKQPCAGLFRFNVIASCSLVISKTLFNKIGGYNERITFQGEDIDLALRVNKHNTPVYCVFDVTLYHNHEDRLNLDGYIDRARKGYHSQFTAEREGVIPVSKNRYHQSGFYLFYSSRFWRKMGTLIYKVLPNWRITDPISNRIVGYLGGLEKFKQWKNVYHQAVPK